MRIILTGGGTAGHVNPALAIAQAARERYKKCEILYIGGMRGIENKLVPAAGIPFKQIKTIGFNRKKPWTLVSAGTKFLLATNGASKIITEFKPDIVIGTGGYVSAAPLYVAIKHKIPTIVHEQNVCPGLVVRLLAGKVSVVATSFEGCGKFLPTNANVVLVGNPIRRAMYTLNEHESRAKLKNFAYPIVVLFGGSLGAERLNEALVELLLSHTERDYMLIASTGERHYGQVMQSLSAGGFKPDDNTQILPYIHDMETVLTAADLCVTRAGAITISEICAAGKPSILIPSPNVSHNHQHLNAQYLERNGAAVIIEEQNLTGQLLGEQVEVLIQNSALLKSMRQRAKALAKIDACEEFLRIIKSLTGNAH